MFKRLTALFRSRNTGTLTVSESKPNSPPCSPSAENAKFAAEQKNLGGQYYMQGNLAGAEHCFHNAITADPSDARGFNNLGVILRQQGRTAEAQAVIKRAVMLDANLFEAHFTLADMAKESGDYAVAILHFERCLAINPDDEDVALGIVHTHFLSGKVDIALVMVQQALKRHPCSAMLYCYLGNILKMAGEIGHAQAAYMRSLEIDPACWQATFGLVKGHLERENRQAAKSLLLQATDHPGTADDQLELGYLLLLLGELEKGFALHEQRFHSQKREYRYISETLPRFGGKPVWQGAPLDGRTLLVWAEQGLGDTLMMMRYLSELRRHGAGILIVYCQSHLLRIVRAQGIADIVECDIVKKISHPFDLYCSTMSLPHILHTTLDSIPASVPYLKIPGELEQKWAQRTATLAGLKVGLVWAGNPEMTKDAQRSIALRELEPLMKLTNVSFVSLQKGGAAAQLQAVKFPIVDWMAECDDLLDTAALIANLDLVIAVDTSIVHLTGALGVPVWLLNRFGSEWRWLLDQSDSPWYPSMRIFRQAVENDWDATILEIKDALQRQLSKS